MKDSNKAKRKHVFKIVDFILYMLVDTFLLILCGYIYIDFCENIIVYDIHTIGDMFGCSYFGGWSIVALLLDIVVLSQVVIEIPTKIIEFVKYVNNRGIK